MTSTDLEAMMQNLNHRVARIEQILPTLATRDDLAPLATRNGVDALGQQLREELATKSHLEALEKKLREELASKSDLEALEKKLREELASKSDLEAMGKKLREELASKSDLEVLRQELREELASKKDLDILRKEFRGELAAGFGDAKRYALVLHEDLKSDIGLIAEHLADVMSRLPPRGC